MSEPLIPDAAVKAIQEGVKTEVIEVDGREFTTRPVHEPPREPRAETLQVSTLTGFVEAVESLNLVDREGTVVHVASPNKVRLVTSLDEKYRTRDVLVQAECSSAISEALFGFSRFVGHEDFVISLMTLFADAGDKANVLKLVGNIQDENVSRVGDDGVTQSVAVRVGITKLAEVEVKNPVRLAPFRTFGEVEQPLSLFVLRMKRREGDLPHCALFEADGGRWKLAAMQAIRDWLAANLTDMTIIA